MKNSNTYKKVKNFIRVTAIVMVILMLAGIVVLFC